MPTRPNCTRHSLRHSCSCSHTCCHPPYGPQDLLPQPLPSAAWECSGSLPRCTRSPRHNGICAQGTWHGSRRKIMLPKRAARHATHRAWFRSMQIACCRPGFDLDQSLRKATWLTAPWLPIILLPRRVGVAGVLCTTSASAVPLVLAVAVRHGASS